MFDRPNRASRPAALAIAVSLALAAPQALAAGEHSGGHGPKDGTPAIGQSGDPADASRTVTVIMRDIEFEPSSITVEKGETVHFVVENKGELVHEFNIGTAAMHAEHQDEMAKMMEQGVLEMDKVHRDMMGEAKEDGHGHMMSHDHANSVLLEPGESAELVWTFSADADLEFACNVPGHYEGGMVGEFHMEHDHGS